MNLTLVTTWSGTEGRAGELQDGCRRCLLRTRPTLPTEAHGTDA
jgi:hypothetical protein